MLGVVARCLLVRVLSRPVGEYVCMFSCVYVLIRRIFVCSSMCAYVEVRACVFVWVFLCLCVYYIVHVSAVLYVLVCERVCATARALLPCLFVLRVF